MFMEVHIHSHCEGIVVCQRADLQARLDILVLNEERAMSYLLHYQPKRVTLPGNQAKTGRNQHR